MAEEFSLFCRFQTCSYPFFLDQQSVFMHLMEILKMYSVFEYIGHVFCLRAILYIHRTS